MKVLKFGGSSIANPERIGMVLDILKGYYVKGEKFTVVFSAFGGITDSLIEMGEMAANGDEEYLDCFEAFSERHRQAAHTLLEPDILEQAMPELENNHEVLKNLLYGIFLVREASKRSMDYVLSFGERNASYIISFALRQAGINARYLDARRIIKTDKTFGSAQVDYRSTYKRIKEHFFENPDIQVVTGFIASARGGLTTTLGRGGSDFTASLLAAGLDAEVIEIWTDVDGVLTADPRKVRKAFTIPVMTYHEAMEMSHFGAKVIYPPTLQPAMSRKIPLRIKNTFNPDFEGTFISDSGDPDGNAVKGISSVNSIALLTMQGTGMVGVPGIAARLFSALADAQINIILITQGSSENAISFAISPSNAPRAKAKVEKAFEHEINLNLVDPIRVEENLSVVAAIGENMRYRPGISGRLFQSLGKNGINAVAIAQGSSERNISVVISGDDESKALNALHEGFFLSDTKELHLFIVGVGLIGGTLIQQILGQAEFLKEKRQIELKVIGMANSKKMLFNQSGIDLNNWKKLLKGSDDKMDIAEFISRMKAYNLPNTIFVDNTADSGISDFYESILDSSISISTPNKIATSSAYLKYQRLKTIAIRRGVHFMYETNVGAGLPVISTINDLILSGDRMLKIEGVLSGSLSFIFNSFGPEKSFSSVVKEAVKLGYTEPDPRIDLNGVDVRRKLIILARETGLPLEVNDVDVDRLLPESCQSAETVDDFFVALEAEDDAFEKLRKDAESEGKVLRFVARLEKSEAHIGLQSVGPDHPFYQLSGSDNMIVFTTERYKERPLVVRGPGAGAEVTAAGVFSEIIKIGSFLA